MNNITPEIVKKYKDKVLGRTNMDYPLYINKLKNEDSLKETLYNMYVFFPLEN